MDSDLFFGFILGLLCGVGVTAGAAAVAEAARRSPSSNGRAALRKVENRHPTWPTRPPR